MIRLPETQQVCTFNSFKNGLDLHGHKVRLMSEEPVAGTSERFARGSGPSLTWSLLLTLVEYYAEMSLISLLLVKHSPFCLAEKKHQHVSFHAGKTRLFRAWTLSEL